MPSTPSTADAGLLQVRRLGVVAYPEALALQRELVAARAAGEIPDTLLLLEHPPVFTLGRRRAAEANVLAPGDTPLIDVERGGDVTWHGPGQLVGYPILSLGPSERDLHGVLRRLEDAVIEVVRSCGLPGRRAPGFTGVWCGPAKVASIGVAVRGWITLHGFALNVDCDMSGFRRINPCGLSAEVMASVASLGGDVPARSVLEARAARAVARAFGRRLAGFWI